MGMYTELHLNSALKADVPTSVLDKLKFMLGETEVDTAIDHPLFSTERWKFMLRCDSYYFDADTHSTLRYDDIAGHCYLCIQTNLKNYGGEIEKFVDWIMPYLDKYEGDFLGYSRYEENEKPDLIFMSTLSKGDQ